MSQLENAISAFEGGFKTNESEIIPKEFETRLKSNETDRFTRSEWRIVGICEK